MKIDLESDQMSEEEAEAVLNAIYKMYHGRTVDDTARFSFMPKLRDWGFKGLTYVLNSVLNSSEMKGRAKNEILDIWKEHLRREPTNEEYTKYEKQVRFFRQAAQEEIIAQINLAESLRQQAAPFLQSRELEKAQKLLDEAVANDIASWLVWHDHGLVRYRQGTNDAYKAAIPSYQKAIAFNSDDNYLWSCDDLCWCYINLAGKDPQWYKQGLSYFQSVIEQFPKRWTALHQCGRILLRMGKLNEAIEYFLKEIELQTDQSWGWSYHDLLVCYRDQGRQDLAYDYFLSVASNDAKNWGVWHSLGWLQWKHKGEPIAAIESYHHSTELNLEGGWFWTWYDMGWCYRESSLPEPEKYRKAFHAFEQAKEKEPKNWRAWHLMGWATEKLGNWNKAIEYYQKALNLEPKSVWCWVDLGRCYRSKPQPQYVNSWEAYQQVLLLEPSDTSAYSEAEVGLQQLENKPLVELRRFLVDSFNLEEIRSLCFDLNIKYEELDGSTIRGRIISLIEYCQKRNRLVDLVRIVRVERPGLIPPTVAALT